MKAVFDIFRHHHLLIPTLIMLPAFVFLTGCPTEGPKSPSGAASKASASASAERPAFGLDEPEEVTPADHDIEVPPAP